MSETHDVEAIDTTPVDRTGWGAGPWDGEPDRIEWEHAGRPCLILRASTTGALCGYAAVDPGHPLHGVSYWDTYDLIEYPDVHGGLTYSDACDGGRICHIPQPGKPDEVWWFGFDCGHHMDISPAVICRHPEIKVGDGTYGETYKPVAYVQAEVNRLAEWLVANDTKQLEPGDD